MAEGVIDYLRHVVDLVTFAAGGGLHRLLLLLRGGLKLLDLRVGDDRIQRLLLAYLHEEVGQGAILLHALAQRRGAHALVERDHRHLAVNLLLADLDLPVAGELKQHEEKRQVAVGLGAGAFLELLDVLLNFFAGNAAQPASACHDRRYITAFMATLWGSASQRSPARAVVSNSS